MIQEDIPDSLKVILWAIALALVVWLVISFMA